MGSSDRALLLDLLDRQVAARPGAPAVVFHQRQLTYGQLDALSNRIARALLIRRPRLAEGPRFIPFCLGKRVEQVAALLAILKVGGAYVPIDPHAPLVRNRQILDDLDAPVLLVDASTRADMLELLRGRERVTELFDLDEDASLIHAQPTAPVPSTRTAESTCYVMYTSGSTGRPKGALIPDRGVVRLVVETDYYEAGPDDCFAQIASVSFDAATFEVWGALLNGARLALIETDVALDPHRLRRRLDESGVTVAFLTTGLFNRLATADPTLFGGLRYLFFGGEAASTEVVRRVSSSRRPPAHLVNVYGPTENTTFSTAHAITGIPEPGARIPIGRAISGTTCHVVDAEMRPVAPGGCGELLVGGAGVAKGYLGRPELTGEKFIPSPFVAGDRLYRTGDVVELRPDGELVFVGRVDNQVKIRGFRVEIEEVELALGAHPDVAQVAIVAEDDVTQTRRLVAYLSLAADRPRPSVAALRAHLEGRLPPYMVPAVFRLTEGFPLGLTGKVDRAALAAMPAETLVSCEPAQAPRDALEADIRERWARALGVVADSIGVESNFFALGGNSLLAAAVVNELSEQHGVDVPLREMLATPTLAGLAAAVRRAPPREPTRLPLADRVDDLPLSWAQEQVWLHQQLAPEVPFYNEPLDVTMRERIHPDRLEQALSLVLERQESLRLRVYLSDGQPRLRVAPLDAFELPRVDLRHLPRHRRTEEARRLAQQLAVRPFDLAAEPPVRFVLVRLEDELFRLYLTGHHLALDGVGMFQAFVPDLHAAYRALARGETPELPALPVGFRDWLAWQRPAEQPAAWEAQLAYWDETLQALPPLELPTDRPRGAEERFEGGRVLVELGSSTTLRLAALAREQNKTLFTVLLAGFTTLLHRLTGQDDIAVGSVVAQGCLPGLDRLCLHRANSVVLRTRVPAASTFLDLLEAAHTTCLGAFANQDVPFQLVASRVAASAGGQGNRRSTPIQVGLLLQPGLGREVEGWELDQLEIHTGTAKFDLTLELHLRDDRLVGRAEYRADLFDRATVERIVSQFQTLLSAMVDAPTRPVATLPLMNEAEQRQVLVTWNDTAVEYEGPETLHGLIERAARRRPGATAIVCEAASLTFKELDRQANALAHALVGAGVLPGDRVGVFMARTPLPLIAQLAVLKAGGAYVPIAAEEPIERVRAILGEAEARVVVVDDARDRLLAEGAVKRLALRGGDIGERDDAPPVSVGPGDLAYVIFTSGSTGRPKGVMIEHRASVQRAGWFGADARLAEGDAVVHLLSTAFDSALLPTWWSLASGAATIVPTTEQMQDPDAIARLMLRHRATAAMATPALWKLLEPALVRQGVRLRYAMTGGERVSGELWARLGGIAERVINGYGPTEVSVMSCQWEGAVGNGESPPIGAPVANTRCYVLDGRREPVPIGVRGELYIAGVGVARGYLGRPDLTEAAFVADPFHGGTMYRSGDIVRWLPTGDLEYLGRADEQVKIRGFRVELGEIEQTLLGHPSVRQCAVVVVEMPAGKQIVAYVTGEPGADLRAYLEARLSAAMVPSAFVSLEAMPLTPNGKTDRRALPAPTFQARDEAPPAGALERQILERFNEALGREVSLNDDFFAAGGDSLGAMQMVARAAKMGLSITVRDVLRHRTVTAIAEALRREQAAERFAENPPTYLDDLGPEPVQPDTNVSVAAGLLRARSPLFSFRESGSLPPLYFVHPAGGSAVCYRALAEHLPGIPFFGLECVDGYAGQTVTNMAARYVAAVRERQPSGPYFLGGWSFGGNLAFEMARQLEEAGEEIGLVAMIDSRPLQHPKQRTFLRMMNEDSAATLCLIGRHFAQMTGKAFPLEYAELRAVPEAEQREVFLERVERHSLFARDMAESFVERFIDDFSACTRIMRHDERRRRGGFDLLLLRAAEVSRHYDGFPAMEEPLADASDPTYGWTSLTRGRVTVHSTPGTHETCVFPPHVGVGAAVLRAELMRRASEGRKLNSLPSLSAAQWSTVLGKLERHTLRAGDVLIEAGAADRRAFLVASGQLEVTRHFTGGVRHVREVGSGMVLGVVAFFDGKPRTATVRALSEVTAYSLTPRALDELVRVAPELAQTITADLARAVAATFREAVLPMKAAQGSQLAGAGLQLPPGSLAEHGPAKRSLSPSLEEPS